VHTTAAIPDAIFYSVKKLIGEGSIGRVHLGRWQETDVAIKVLTSLSNIAVGMASASPTPRASGAPGAARNEAGDSYADDALATKRTLEREARAPLHPYPHRSRFACVNLAATCACRASGKCRCLRSESVLGFICSHVISQQRCLSGGAAAGQVNIVAAIRHPNVVLFMGVCLDPPCMVTEWCAPRPHPLQRPRGRGPAAGLLSQRVACQCWRVRARGVRHDSGWREASRSTAAGAVGRVRAESA